MSNQLIYDNIRQAEKGARISIIAYLILSSFKLFIGYFYASSGLFADGINNATDVMASICVLIGLKISKKPADHDHLYGHFRAELISSLIAAFIMLYAGIQVVFYAIKKIIFYNVEQPSLLSAIVATISALCMYLVFLYNKRLAQKIGSPSLKAAAFDNLSDALVSLGTLLGIIFTWLGFSYADIITAIILGCIISYTAIKIFLEATHILTDGIDTATIDKVTYIVSSIDEVIDIKAIKGRTHGLMHFIDVTVTVNPYLNVIQSHDITVNIEQALQNEFQTIETLVHLEPSEKFNYQGESINEK